MHSTLDVQEIATTELSSPSVAAKIRMIKYHQVREAIAEGEYFWQVKQSFKKLKDFKVWLEQEGFTWKDACRHLKLYEIFASFPLEQIGWLSLNTLYSLCQPKYRELLAQLRSLPKWIDAKVCEMMRRVRSYRSASDSNSPMKTVREAAKKSRRSPEPTPVSGWKRMPKGGGRYYAVSLHDDKLGSLIQQYADRKNWLPSKVIEEAVLSLCQLQPLDGFSMREYKFGARSLKDCQRNWDLIQSRKLNRGSKE